MQLLKDTANDRLFLARELDAWKRSDKRRAQIDAQRYYAGRQDILRRVRTVIGEGGQLAVVDNLPNSRIVDNQYARMVDQKVNYLLGKPPSIECGDARYAAALGGVLDSRFWRELRRVGEDALGEGLAWMYVYYDAAGVLRFRRFAGHEILPLWRDAAHTLLDAAVRLYETERQEANGTTLVEEHVEVYVSSGVYRYLLQNGTLVAETPSWQPYLLPMDAQNLPNCGIEACGGLCWERIPLVAFRANSRELSLLGRIRSLQDAVNLIMSTFENCMLEDPRNTIMVLVNYDGENLGEFRRNLAAYGAVKVRSTHDAPNGDIKTLSVEVNAENYREILSVLKRALVENARGFDAHDERLSGNPNQMSIQSVYSDIDLDANAMESEFQAAMEELMWFVQVHLENRGIRKLDKTRLRVVFSRSTPVNAAELVERCVVSAGLVSRKTLLAHHPFVTDVQEELRELAREQANPKGGETDGLEG